MSWNDSNKIKLPVQQMDQPYVILMNHAAFKSIASVVRSAIVKK